jgi:hypothetical protein
VTPPIAVTPALAEPPPLLPALPVPPPPVQKPVAPAPAPKPAAVATAAPAPPPPCRAPPAPWYVDASVGVVAVPDVLFNAFSRLDQHPSLRWTAVDAALQLPWGDGRWIALRAGLALPQVPAVNWYSSADADVGELPRYTVFDLKLVDLGAEWLLRHPLAPSLDVVVRLGLNALVFVGDVTRTEALPTCDPAKKATCPHWNAVARSTADVPPLLIGPHATAGLTWWMAPKFGLQLDAGIRDALWAGAGVVTRL